MSVKSKNKHLPRRENAMFFEFKSNTNEQKSENGANVMTRGYPPSD